MTDGSSVDRDNIELDGLNLASDFLKEETNKVNVSWESLLEDSIDKRAAKALNIQSVRDLLTKDNTGEGKLSPAHSLIEVIYSSMNSDIQRAVRSPSRSSGRSSVTSARTGSNGADTSSTSNKDENCSKFIEQFYTSTPKYSDIKHNGQLEDLNFLPHNDSSFSEPEFEVAFDQPQQTMDILSTAGNLQARREYHGGYGTPSSYASDQEMILYFDNSSTPTKLNENVTLSSSDITPVEKNEKGLSLMPEIEGRTQQQIESPTHYDDLTSDPRVIPRSISLKAIEELNSKHDMQSAAKKCEDTIEVLERFATCPEHTDAILGTDVSPDSRSALNLAVNKPRPEKVSDGAQRLLKMIKMASDIVMNDEINESKILEFNSPNKTAAPETQSLESFQEFRECVINLKQIEKQRLDISESNERQNETSDDIDNKKSESVVVKEQKILIDFSELMDSIQNCKQEIMSSFDVNQPIKIETEQFSSTNFLDDKKVNSQQNIESCDPEKENILNSSDELSYNYELDKTADSIVTELLDSFSKGNVKCSEIESNENSYYDEKTTSVLSQNPIIVINDVDGKYLPDNEQLDNNESKERSKRISSQLADDSIKQFTNESLKSIPGQRHIDKTDNKPLPSALNQDKHQDTTCRTASNYTITTIVDDIESGYHKSTHTCLKQGKTKNPTSDPFKTNNGPLGNENKDINKANVISHRVDLTKEGITLPKHLDNMCNIKYSNENMVHEENVAIQNVDLQTVLESQKNSSKIFTKIGEFSPSENSVRLGEVLNSNPLYFNQEKPDTYVKQVEATLTQNKEKLSIDDSESEVMIENYGRNPFNENKSSKEKEVPVEQTEVNTLKLEKKSLHFDEFGDEIYDVDFTKYPDFLNSNKSSERVFADLDQSNSSNHSFLLTDPKNNKNEVITTPNKNILIPLKINEDIEGFQIRTAEISLATNFVESKLISSNTLSENNVGVRKSRDVSSNTKTLIPKSLGPSKTIQIPENFDRHFHKKFKDLENKINEILKPSPYNPRSVSVPNKRHVNAGATKPSLVFERQENNQIRLKRIKNSGDFKTYAPDKDIPENEKLLSSNFHLSRPTRRNIFPPNSITDKADIDVISTPRSLVSICNIDELVMEESERFLKTAHMLDSSQDLNRRKPTAVTEEIAAVTKAMSYIKHDLAKGKRDVKALQQDLEETWTRMNKFELELSQSDCESEVVGVFKNYVHDVA